MNRRNFIRVAGGGIVSTAAVSSLSGCGLSSAYPPQAVEAWAGPGAEPDLRRWALGYAILAPNSHNRQPWLVDLSTPNAITLFVDRERMLPMTDPWFRQIVVSQGTFIESLVMALRERGVEPQVKLFPQGEFKPREVDARPVAQITWMPATASVPKDPLFAQLLKRHTAKVDYDMTRAVPADTLALLKSALVDANINYGGTLEAAQIEPLRTLCWQSAKVELLTPRTVMESIKLTRVGPAEILQHRGTIALRLMPSRCCKISLGPTRVSLMLSMTVRGVSSSTLADCQHSVRSDAICAASSVLPKLMDESVNAVLSCPTVSAGTARVKS